MQRLGNPRDAVCFICFSFVSHERGFGFDIGNGDISFKFSAIINTIVKK